MFDGSKSRDANFVYARRQRSYCKAILPPPGWHTSSLSFAKNVPVSKCRMRPANSAPLPQLIGGGLDQFCAADFLEALGRQFGDQ